VQPLMDPSHRHPAVSVARSAGLANCSLFNIPLPAKGEAARSASLSSALLPSAFPRVPFPGKCRAHVETAYIRAAHEEMDRSYTCGTERIRAVRSSLVGVLEQLQRVC
jgi:hypothetical protein